MNATFHDHFSDAAGGYAQSRPTYPDAFFRRLAELAPGRESAEQIAHAAPLANVNYSVQPAESTGFPAVSFDALCVAQALHWFDVERFYAEAKRVLKPRAVVLVVGYGWMEISPDIDAVLKRAVIEPLGFWPPQNRLLWNEYRDLPFPFERVAFPAMVIETRWTLAQLVAYIGTWTATRSLSAAKPGRPH